MICHKAMTIPFEAVTVSVDYADFLAETLPLLAKHASRIVVVTTALDTETHRVVARYPQAEVAVTDAFFREGAAFRKGAAINVGLDRLRQDGWVLHIDADIALLDPIPLANLDSKTLWTAPRLRVHGRTQWKQVCHRDMQPLHLVEEPMQRHGQARAIGYFQLWHAPSHPYRYSESSPNAGHDDVLFSRQFHERGFLDLFVYHLESDDSGTPRIDWNGRRSTRF